MKNPKEFPEFSKGAFWSRTKEELLDSAGVTDSGLSSPEAENRLARYGENILKERKRDSALHLLLGQFKNPLVLILIFAAIISAVVSEYVDTVIVLLIVLASALLSFTQEYSAGKAVQKLRSQVTLASQVKRDGAVMTLPSQDLVPGDLVLLSAGSLIPSDGIVISAKDFFVNEAALTGETFPVEKQPGTAPETAPLTQRNNMVFMGTSVRSGTAEVLVMKTGLSTEFGKIAEKLSQGPEETEFEKGVRKFGSLLSKIMLALVAGIFIVNTVFHRPILDSLLFAVALAVGLTPELLPAIISISLSKGAQSMAKKGVIVKRLNAIENLGSMDTLCTDKTGTLTHGAVELGQTPDSLGQDDPEVFYWASLNAAFQTGIKNPLDEAILKKAAPDTKGIRKLEEIPYDFHRKRLSVVVDDPNNKKGPVMVTKGALNTVLAVCENVRQGADVLPLEGSRLKEINGRFAEYSSQGFRVLGLAIKEVTLKQEYTVEEDEKNMTFLGFLLFLDPPREDARETLSELRSLGVEVKIITGDNRLVARYIAKAIGLLEDSVLPAEDFAALSDADFSAIAEKTSIFAEVDPAQKERIIRAIQKNGHVVGYMGDGINDAPALNAADIGISVESAVDVAKETADFVLLKQGLSVLAEGIRQGRKTFSNTLKYIYTTTSANFGNMVSMAGASLFLPFLPMLAKQILLNNFLSDFPAVGIPGDNVDEEMLTKPRRWDVRSIRGFMVVFGLVSSLFDYATFGLLLFIARAQEPQFQTAWFIESLLSELVIALVVRTRRLFYRSKPGRVLWVSTLIAAVLALAIPYLPFAGALGFVPLPLWLIASLIGLTALYVLAAEIAKKIYFKNPNN